MNFLIEDEDDVGGPWEDDYGAVLLFWENDLNILSCCSVGKEEYKG